MINELGTKLDEFTASEVRESHKESDDDDLS